MKLEVQKDINPWGEYRRTQPRETHGMIAEEAEVLTVVEEGAPIMLWQMRERLIELGYALKAEGKSSSLAALVQRLVNEGKLSRLSTREIHADYGIRTTEGVKSLYVLGPSYVPIMPEIDAIKEDLSGGVCDVDSSSGQSEERRSLLASWRSSLRL